MTVLLVLGLAAPVAAQERVVRLPSFVPPDALAFESSVTPVVQVGPPEQPDAFSLTMAGAVGAAVGTVAGAYAGYQLDHGGLNIGCSSGCEDPGFVGLLVGWAVGPAITTPLAVHLFNGKRGSLSKSYQYAAMVSGAGIVAIMAKAPVALLLIPVGQTISAVIIERTTPPE